MVALELKEQEVEIRPGYRQPPCKPQVVGVAHKIKTMPEGLHAVLVSSMCERLEAALCTCAPAVRTALCSKKDLSRFYSLSQASAGSEFI
jgi:hypothetical protein